MATLRAAVSVALSLCFLSLPALAQEVTLNSHDGAVTLSGELLGFDGEFYRLDTIYGELTLDGSEVLCTGAACPDLTDYVAEATFSGAPGMGAVLIPALIEAFALRKGFELQRDNSSDSAFSYTLADPATAEPRARFHLKLSDTAEGFADLLAGEADLVMARREVSPEEAIRGQEIGLGDLRATRRSHVLALDALVPLVSARNPLTTITMADLAQVLSGDITNWAELGGADMPIALHLHDPASGLGQITERLFLQGRTATAAKAAIHHKSGATLSEAVAQDPFALGIGSRAEMGLAFELSLSGSCGFARQASRRMVKSGDYPLVTPMFLYTPARRLPRLIHEFLAFTAEPAAQLVIRRAGFVDQLPEEIALDDQGNRIANAVLHAEGETGLGDLQRMLRRLRPLRRLSTSFRFESGSTRLDAQSHRNIQSLTHALTSGFYDGRRLLFVSFSDPETPEEADAATQIAETLRDRLIFAAKETRLDRVKLDIAAFGEMMPLACDESEWAHHTNRRVEIWIK